ncbi:MAG: RNA polymerase sigma factor [Ktedonobacterales bacterium]
MEHMSAGLLDRQQQVWQAERPRLVALCTRLTGDSTTAEDLAQETLLEAWRHRDRLRDPARARQWLTGIARNVSLRWHRARSREVARTIVPPAPADSDATSAPTWDDLLAGDADLAVELERHELVALLDAALALLSPATRAALLAHYVEQTPLAELAGRLGASDAVVAMRLQRGKLALRRILTTELYQKFAPHAPDLYERHAWEETPLWCTTCGRRHLLGRYHVAEGELWLRCPECSPDPALIHIHTDMPGILGGVRGYQRARNRVIAWEHRYYSSPLRRNRHNPQMPCLRCGLLLPVTCERPRYIASSPIGNNLGLRHVCPVCRFDCWKSLDDLALATPTGRDFTRRNPRIRTLPYQHVEAQGRPVILARFESVTTAARFVARFDTATFELLSIEE